jgi:hypothetical protein
MTFKVGDVVVIERAHDVIGWLWLPEMESFIGCAGIVTSIKKTYRNTDRGHEYVAVATYLPGDCQMGYVYDVDVLRLATEDEARSIKFIVAIKNVTLQGK